MALYTGNEVYIRIEGEVLHFLTVLAGVLQGCPASGNLFVIAINPILTMLCRLTGSGEQVRAFGDDVAGVLHLLRRLKDFYSIFKIAIQAANLELKPSKCVLIPLGVPLTEAVKDFVLQFLRRKIPEWAEFSIKSHVKCLGSKSVREEAHTSGKPQLANGLTALLR